MPTTQQVVLGERSYPIHIGHGLMRRAPLYAPHVKNRLAALVTNTTVGPLYANAVESTLREAGASGREVHRPSGAMS